MAPSSTASSAIIEEHFKDLRVAIPTIRQANKFSLGHLNYANAQVILAKSALDLRLKINDINNADTKTVIIKDEIITKPIKSKKNLKAKITQTNKESTCIEISDASDHEEQSLSDFEFQNDDELDLEHESNVINVFPDGSAMYSLMLNGNILDSLKYSGPHNIHVYNTCAFDSLIHIIIFGMSINFNFLNSIESSSDKAMKLALDIFRSKKVKMCHYYYRSKFLYGSKKFKEDEGTQDEGFEHIKFVNCFSNLHNLTHSFLRNTPCLKFENNCSLCNWNSIKTYSILEIYEESFLQNGFSNFQNTVNELDQNGEIIVETQIKLYDHLLFGTELTSEDFAIDSIPNNIHVFDENYNLKGINSFVDNCHYVSYFNTNFGWLRYDDLRREPSFVTNDKKVNPCLLLYMKN